MRFEPGFVASVGFENPLKTARNNVGEILGTKVGGIPTQLVDDSNFKPNGQGFFLGGGGWRGNDSHDGCSLLRGLSWCKSFVGAEVGNREAQGVNRDQTVWNAVPEHKHE